MDRRRNDRCLVAKKKRAANESAKPPEIIPGVTWIRDMATLANEYRKRHDAGEQIELLYLDQAIDVVDATAKHYLSDADSMIAADVVKGVADVLMRMVAEPVAAGWREYAWRAVQLGVATGTVIGPFVALPVALGPSIFANPTTLADLRGELALSETAVAKLGEWLKLVGVEHHRAAVDVLRTSNPSTATTPTAPPAATKTTNDLPDQDAPTPANDERPAHSIDFRSVNWFGAPYTFSEHQAACVKILWEHWLQRTPDVGGKTLLAEAESDAERIDLVFRDHPAWNTMIVKGVKRGTRRLQEPARARIDT